MNLKEFIDICAVSIDSLIKRLGVEGHYDVFFSVGSDIAREEYIKNPSVEINILMKKIHERYLGMLDSTIHDR